MKEQWKKLDSDAKLLLNVEEGRSVPINIQLPLSAYTNQDKNGCCNKLLTTLRVFVLLAILVLLSWTATTLYTNYYVKSSVIIRENETPTYVNEANKLAFKNKVWENDITNSASNNINDSESNSKKYQNEPVETEIVATAVEFKTSEVTEDASFITEPESIIKSDKSLNTVIGYLQNLAEQRETFEKEDMSKSYSKEEARLDGTQKNEVEEGDPQLLPIIQELGLRGFENMFSDAQSSKEILTNLHGFIEDSEELEYNNLGNIFIQIKKNQEAMDKFFKAIIDADMIDNKDLINSEEKSSNNYQESESDEKNNELTSNEPRISLPDSAFIDRIVKIIIEDPINQGLDEFNKTDEEENQSEEMVKEEMGPINEILSEIISRKPTISEKLFSLIPQSDMYILMARRIEEILGDYDDLLIWYFNNRNNPDPIDDYGQLKMITSRLLFGSDIIEYNRYSVFVLTALTDDEFINDFTKMTVPMQPKIKAITYTQRQVVNRLSTKAHMEKLYREGDQTAEEISNAISSINFLELKLLGKTFSEEVDKSSNESMKENEEESTTQIMSKETEKIISEELIKEDEVETSPQMVSEEINRDISENTIKEDEEESSSQMVSEESDKNLSDESIKVDEEESSLQMISEEIDKSISNESIKEDEEFAQTISEETDKNISDESLQEDNKDILLEPILQNRIIVDKFENEWDNQNFFIKEVEPLQEDFEETLSQSISQEFKETPDLSAVDEFEDELEKRLHFLIDDVLHSKEESDESVNMNDLLTVYDGFDY